MSSVMEIAMRDMGDLIALANANLKILSGPVVNVLGYGAKGDGVTDDTPTIQKAIEACPAGGQVIFPVGTYRLRGNGTELLLITKPIRLIGYGVYSTLLISADVGASTDVIRISPDVSYKKEFAGIGSLNIEPESGTPARHGIHIDLQSPSQYLSKHTIQDMDIRQLGGHAIHLSNPVNTDGYFTSTICDNRLYGGMFFERIGDSIYILRNSITGENVGIELTAVEGAVTVLVQANNITAAGGAIKADTASQLKILYNQLEQVSPYTGTVDAMVYITNSQLPEVIGNNLNGRDLVDHNIRFGTNVLLGKIDTNTFRQGSAECIRVDAGTVGATITAQNIYINLSEDEIPPSILDNGTGTSGVNKVLTLLNGYTAVDTVNYNVPSIYKDCEGTVFVKGVIQPGIRTAGTVIFNLPVNFRPKKSLTVVVGYVNYTSAKVELMPLIIEPTGDVSLPRTLDSAEIYLDTISFTTR